MLVGSYEKPGWLGYQITEMENFPYEHSSVDNRDETLKTKLLRSRNIAAKMA